MCRFVRFFAIVLAGVFAPARANAYAPLVAASYAETRIRGIDLAAPTFVGGSSDVALGKHRGFRFGCDDLASGSPHAARGVEGAAAAGESLVVNGRAYINSTRVIERAAAESGPYHNFPGSFDRLILEQGEQKLSVGFFQKAKPGYGASGVQYSLPGAINGQQGVFEIGTRLSTSGNVELSMHRFFRPLP